ncbi:unnamed protein product [Prorocentrum cordatum]|uniref:Thioredoxin domain-containing protein n=1 Tax=Prorocentrum cordatum TaxID=2364126 RepID=A0ABN9T219_9DINO|nr:unnamed protein product [Polarella glacialis]
MRPRLGPWAVAAAVLPRSARGEVVSLTDADFDARVAGGIPKPWFVKFYAPWCGHCRAMAKDWALLAQQLEGEAGIAQVDATTEVGVATEWGIRGYPTLVLISGNRSKKYSGFYSVDAWARFVRAGLGIGEAWPLPKHRSRPERLLCSALEVLLELVLPLLVVAAVLCGAFWYLWSLEKRAQRSREALGAREEERWREQMEAARVRRREGRARPESQGGAVELAADGGRER